MDNGNCIYNGPFLNNKKHGHGFYSSDNELYVGLWKEDKKHGHGVHTLVHKFVYIGNWKDDIKDGIGKITWKRRSTRLRHRGITLNNPNERGPRNHGVHLFEKDPLAGLLSCDLEAAIGNGNLFHASILSSHGLERPSFADFP